MNQRGFTLLELMMVVIIGFVLLSVVLYYVVYLGIIVWFINHFNWDILKGLFH